MLLRRRSSKARKSLQEKNQREDKNIELTKNYEVILQGIMLGKQTPYRKANSLRSNHASTTDYKETGDHGFRQRQQNMSAGENSNNTVCTIYVKFIPGKVNVGIIGVSGFIGRG